MNTTTSLSSLRNASAQPPKARGLVELLNDDKVKKGLAAVAGKILSPDRVMKLVTNAIYRTPQLALCEPKTVLGALMASMSLGLEPNTPQGHAYLIPYKRRAQANGKWMDVHECQFQVGYRGLIVLAYRSPRVKSLEGEAIHKNDHFKHMKGSRNFLEHEIALEDRGPLVGAYCHSHLSDGMEIATVMPLARIHSVRDRSETFRALQARLEQAKAKAEANPRDSSARKDYEKALRNYEETPWVLREDEMSAKTVIKRHVNAKMPLDPGDLLRTAVELDNASDRGIIDLSILADPDAALVLSQDGVIPHEAITTDGAEDGDDADKEDAAGDAGGAAPETTHTEPGAEPDPDTTKPTRAALE